MSEVEAPEQVVDGHSVIGALGSSDPKALRTLKEQLQPLLNPRSYLIPESIEDVMSFPFGHPSVKIGQGKIYLKRRLVGRVRAVAELLLTLPEVGAVVSLHSAYQETLQLMDREVNRRCGETTTSIDIALEELVDAVLEKVEVFTFLFLVEGVELKDVKWLELGRVEVLEVSAEEVAGIVGRMRNATPQESKYAEWVRELLDKSYLGKVCLRIVAKGDHDKATELALDRARATVGLLRFMTCLGSPEEACGPRFSIRLARDQDARGETRVEIGSVSGVGIWRGVVEGMWRLPIDAEYLRKLRENAFLDELAVICLHKRESELEAAIATAVRWISEAQDDGTRPGAFVKLWIAIESLLQPEEGAITEHLRRVIASLLVYGGYRFLPLEEFRQTIGRVGELYKKRCKAAHEGQETQISTDDLSDSCKYAVWTVLTCLALRKLNYTTLNQVRQEADRHHLIEWRYVAVRGSGVYHSTRCRVAWRHAHGPLVGFDSITDAEQGGLRRCKRCSGLSPLRGGPEPASGTAGDQR